MQAIPTKILATPEAYQLLTSITDGEKVQKAVRQALLAATNKRESPLTDYFIVNCPISLHGRITETSEGKTFTILLYSKNGKGAMFFIYDELYQAAFDSAVPVEMV